MSRLPIGWTSVALGDICTAVAGSAKPEPAVTYELYSVPALPGGEPETILGCAIGSVKRPVAPNDVLLCKINPRINRVWIVGNDKGHPQLASTEFIPLRLPEGMATTARYLLWYLRSPFFRSWIKLNAEGATGSHTRAKSPQILRQLIPVAPVEEQRRIVAALEEQLSRLDAGVVALERARLGLRQMRASLLRAATNGSLIGKRDSTWPACSLGDVVTVASGQTPRGLRVADAGPIAYYKVGDMNAADGRFMAESRTYVTQADADTAKLHIRPAGTVIFPKRGGAIATNKKRVLATPAAYDLNTMGLVPGPDIDPGFLYAWISSIDLNTLADGSNVPQINHGDLRNLTLALPPRRVQADVVEHLNSKLERADALDGIVVMALRRCVRLRSAVLTAAFSGKLVTQDPREEPASKLLQRVVLDRHNPAKACGSQRKKVTA